MSADLKLAQPGLLGIQLRQALITAKYQNDRYDISGELLPRDTGQITFEADGYRNAGLKANLQARGLSARWLTVGVLSLPQLTQSLPAHQGDATDLGTLLVNTFGGSLDGQLTALRQSQLALADARLDRRQKEAFHPEDLRGGTGASRSARGSWPHGQLSLGGGVPSPDNGASAGKGTRRPGADCSRSRPGVAFKRDVAA